MMQPLPRWFTFAVGFALSTLGALQLVGIWPAESAKGKLLIVGTMVCGWLMGQGRALLSGAPPPAPLELPPPPKGP